MKRKFLYVLLALAVYGVFFLATAPARVALPYLKRNLPTLVHITDVRGSVWSGHLSLLVQTMTGTKALSHVHFGFSVLSLLHGKLGYNLHFSGPLQGRMQVAFGSQSMDLFDLKLAARVAPLVAFMPEVQSFGPTGALQLTASHLAWGPHLDGQGQLTWEQAALVSAPVSPLGSYAAQFVLHDGTIRYQVHTLTGRLRVTGRGRYVVATGVVSFTGDVLGRGMRLGGLVQNVGAPDGHGGRTISFQMPI